MLAVTESGKGTPLVLLHGWGLHSGVWQSVLPELEKQFHCYAVDMLGHGESQAALPFSLENMRVALNQLVDSIDSNNVIVLAWSLGGLVALDFLSQRNEQTKKVKQLMLVCSNACFCNKSHWEYGIDTEILDSFAEQLETDYKKTVDKFLALQMFGIDDYKVSLKILKKSVASRPEPSVNTLSKGLQILKEADFTNKLNLIEQTVFMLSGEHDRLMPYQAAESMAALFKNAQSEMIRGAGHAPFISHQKEFMQLINEFSNGNTDV